MEKFGDSDDVSVWEYPLDPASKAVLSYVTPHSLGTWSRPRQHDTDVFLLSQRISTSQERTALAYKVLQL